MNPRKTWTIINPETGEVTEFIERREGDRIRTQAQNEYAYKMYERYADKTDFIWVRFQYNNPFCPFLQVYNISRMICLATYINNNGFAMFKQDVTNMLNVNKNNSLDLRKELEQNNVIFFNDDEIIVNNNFFYRGDLQSGSTNHIRLFTETTRNVFNSCSSTKHKVLSYVFMMIPYVSRQSNILCKNQDEQDISKIEHMTIQDFCGIIDYEVLHASRLRKNLLDFRIGDELAVGFYNDKNTMKFEDRGRYVVVNPKLFYGGDRTTNIYKNICKLFETQKFFD